MDRKDNTRTRVTRIGKGKKIVFANNVFKHQSTLKIKQRERRPRKGRLGGDCAAFATPSWVPSKENEKRNTLLTDGHVVLKDSTP